ncbi:MAG: glycine--tRNA ligase subunit beta [Myxococcota bacterium]
MELIFEIGCEELPASFIEPALEQMETFLEERCEELRIDIDGLRTMATPRRLTLVVEEMAERQSDLEEERTGPPAGISWDDDGNPTPAAQGFARGQGVDVDDLYTVDTDKGEYVAAKVFEEGQPTAELLPAVLDDMIEALHFPKSMRWAANTERFARPVRWILAVADGDVVPVTFAGVDSSNQTRGHRFASPRAFEVDSIDKYVDQLEARHVIVDHHRRREKIEHLLENAADDIDGEVIDDPELLDEVNFLVEDAYLTVLDYGEAYLELPDEVLISSMRSHQRYFAIEEEDGAALRPYCAVIYNTPVKTPEEVYEGNLRVLRARLDDARFFWEKDLKRSLEDRIDDLNDVVWIAKIGSMKKRAERISNLAGALAEAIGLDVKDHASRAGLLSKSDLVTQMVGEFPDLQGTMGREYALADGEPAEVAAAIYEQYLPKGAHAEIPQTAAGACVALAEKLDALVGCFGVDMVPSSASDPYGLRRAALGVIRILQGRAYSISVTEMFELAIDAYEALSPDVLQGDRDGLVAELVDFTATRLKYQLASDFPTEVVDAVLAANKNDVLSARDRVEALDELRGEEDFEPLAIGFKRVVNIVRKEADTGAILGNVDATLLEEDEEKALWEAYKDAAGDLEVALGERDWEAACHVLIGLKSPVDDFFDNVMVNAEDEALRQNRLAMLNDLRGLFLQVADISVLSG